MSAAAGDVEVRIASLHLHPVKSCGGIAVDEALVIETGLEFDRAWAVVDERGVAVTQRELPRMALVRPQIRFSEVILRAPGMLALHLSVGTVEEPVRVRIWDEEVPAFDMGAVAAQWFTDLLGQPLRLVRFDPEHRRLSNTKWTQGAEALNQFSDGYPVLLAGTASLDLLNARLAAKGQAAVGIERFRPNIVLEGLEAHDEDRLDVLRIAAGEGEVRLRAVKPCSRCPIPDIDPATAQVDPVVTDTLQGYRRSAVLDGAIAFGMNAIVVDGIDRTLRVGQAVAAGYRFD